MMDEDYSKWLPTARLCELLQTLPPDSRVTVNTVGNLLVYSADGATPLAYVDLCRGGRVESFLDDPRPLQASGDTAVEHRKCQRCVRSNK